MRVLELFAGGVGGWHYGLKAAGGYEIVAASELLPWRQKVYQAVHGPVEMFGDITELYTGDMDIDVVVGSPPCQDISTANSKAKGVDGDGLFFEWVRIIRECRPIWAAAENSSALRTRGYDRVADELETSGYACWPFVVRASDLGANHGRARSWVIAVREDGYANRERLALRQEQPARDQLTPLERAIRAPDPDHKGPWAAGVPDLSNLDDGAAAQLAENSALYRAVCEAQGEALIPQIPYVIGRVMNHLLG